MVSSFINLIKFNKKEEQDKPLIPANKSKLWAAVLDPLVFNMVEKTFSAVKIKNKHHYYLGNPNYANILFGLHSCFHDGQVAYYICQKAFNPDFYMMIHELYRLPVLSKIGGFSVEKETPQEAMKSINYAAELLKDKRNMVWIFPQGRVMPPDYRPVKFESGLTYIAHKVKKVNLIPVAIKYTYIRQNKPEVFAEFGEPVIVDKGIQNKREFTANLEQNIATLAEMQVKRISAGRLDDYEYLYQSQQPIYYRWEHILKYFLYDRRYINKK